MSVALCCFSTVSAEYTSTNTADTFRISCIFLFPNLFAKNLAIV